LQLLPSTLLPPLLLLPAAARAAGVTWPSTFSSSVLGWMLLLQRCSCCLLLLHLHHQGVACCHSLPQSREWYSTLLLLQCNLCAALATACNSSSSRGKAVAVLGHWLLQPQQAWS
jgi:hypothetical protein